MTIKTSISAEYGIDKIDFTQTGTGAIQRNGVEKLRETVSVKDFGALGDGETDDTEAIQATINYAAGKAAVYIPGATYLTSAELLVPSNSLIYGDGPGKTIITRTSDALANQCGFTNSNNTRTDANTGNVNITIRDLEIVGALGTATGSVDAATSGCGIGLAFVENALIENVFSRRWSKHCFDVSAKYYWTADDPKPNEYVPGPSSNVVLRDCSGTESGDDIITTHFSGAISIENPNCYGSETIGGINLNRNGIEIDDGSYDVIISGGLIKNCNSGIEIKGHNYAPAATRVRIYGTTIRGCSRCINLRHMLFYGPASVDYPTFLGYSNTAKDILISGVTVYAPQGYASGTLLPRALRVASYDNVKVIGLTVIQTDETIGDTATSEDEDTSSPIYIHLGARNVVIDGLTVRNYSAANEAIVRITGTGRGCVSVINSTFEECENVPAILVSGSINGITIDKVNAYQTGTTIPNAIEFTYQPENYKNEVRNIITTGYTNTISTGAALALFTNEMDTGKLNRWIGADTTDDISSLPIEVISIGWTEGTQDLGIGEGVKYSYKFKLNSDATLWEGAYCGSYKFSTSDTDTSTGLHFATRSNADGGTTATARWEVMHNGAFRGLGSGSPEGVITAPVGALWTRTDGGTGTTLYVKETGSGNTGWVAK